MVVIEDTHPIIGPVLWVWSDRIKPYETKTGHRKFSVAGQLPPISVSYDEVPLSIHQGELTGLMIPKFLAEMNGIHAN